MRIWEYPPILTGNPATDVRQLTEYLTRLVQYLEQKERESEGNDAGGTLHKQN